LFGREPAMEDKKRFVQMACRMVEALAELKHQRYARLLEWLSKTTNYLQQLNTQTRKMSVALQRRWLAAADRCCACAHNLLNDTTYSISRVQQLPETSQRKAPTLALIVDELRQLEDEFGGIEFDNKQNTVSVITEPITLEDVALGPFRIQLELDALERLYYSSPYRIIALEPNGACSDESVTHPHVNGERLCEGDGCVAIRAAIEEGRICDFFVLVRNILNTYNPDSPYVSLSDWEGTSCYDCGYTMSSEDTYYCERCGHDYCSDCSTYCRHCEETVCLGCSGQCSYCEEFVCPKCVGKCRECEEPFCPSCLEDGLCPNCKQDKENEDEPQEEEQIDDHENTSRSEPQPTEAELASPERVRDPEIQSDRVGEAAVLPRQIR
jgi:hypothetical protein